MERLTIKYEGLFVPKKTCTIDRFGEADDCDSCDSVCESDCENCAVQECFTRLGEYEDTGLTPERIRELDRLYSEKYREVAKLRRRDTPVKVKPLEIYHPVGYRVGQCSKCENIVRDYMKFCFECGCRLEWGSRKERQKWKDRMLQNFMKKGRR